jgi:hypothetical protein
VVTTSRCGPHPQAALLEHIDARMVDVIKAASTSRTSMAASAEQKGEPSGTDAARYEVRGVVRCDGSDATLVSVLTAVRGKQATLNRVSDVARRLGECRDDHCTL